MKTIKSLFFSMATLVALSVSFTSCDAITDALSKEVEIEAPAIDFSIGGATAAPMQKIGTGANVEHVWLDKPAVDVKTKLTEELAKNNLTIDKVKTLLLTESYIDITTELNENLNLGNIKLYINDFLVAEGDGNVTAISTGIVFQFDTPYDIFGSIETGSMHIKITSDQPKPTKQLAMKLLNKYKSKISLL